MATPEVADIRNVVVAGDQARMAGTLMIKRGIEVGHIFQLGDKYSRALSAAVQGEDGRNQILTMGCYGIGVTRVVAAAIEQNYDERGIVWPDNIAPFGGYPANEHAQVLPCAGAGGETVRRAARAGYRSADGRP